MQAEKPNIVLINCDDLGYGDLGCFGSKRNHTPTLDKIAEEGIKFTDFYMASPVSSPSRGAMMTGCYPKRIGFGSFDGESVLFPGRGLGLNPNEITIADILKDRDYSTMIIGKWHCGDQPEFLPTNHGFDHYYGLPYSNDMGRQSRDGKPNRYPPLPLMLDEQVIQQQPDQTSLTERYVEMGIRFIRENKDKPFFLYLAHMHVHLPLYAPDRFLKQSQNGDYGAAVECIDWATKVILDELKQLDIKEETLIIFTSDNGARGDYGGSNAPLRGGKTTTWEGGMRVPCIMYWPGTIPKGKVCSEVATSMDLLPTIAKFAGADLPQDRVIDGKNISSLMLGEDGAKSSHDAFFYYSGDNLEAVRCGDWKLHIRKGGEKIKALYNLREDSGETENVYKKHPKIVEKLKMYIEVCRQDLGDDAIGLNGENVRCVGRVQDPKLLTSYDPNHPYIIAMYDKEDVG